MDVLPSRLSWAVSLIVILLLSLGLVGGDLGGCDFVGCRGQIRAHPLGRPHFTGTTVPSLRIRGTKTCHRRKRLAARGQGRLRAVRRDDNQHYRPMPDRAAIR